MLGMTALGVETNEWACATATAAGHECLQADVAALDPASLAPVWGLIGSPPCQAYSTAGKGLGRQDKPLVIACAHELAAGHDSRAVRLAECADRRSLLTVEPLRYALALRPRWIALEQVPAVLELWTIFASLLEVHGYHTAAGVLSAERYGVPQTRKRAFLIASLDGAVELPAATHRSYHPRRKETPEEELALAPWVSMAQALGWSTADQVGFPRRNDTPSNHRARSDDGEYRARDRRPGCEPAATLTSRTRSWSRQPCVQIRRSGSRIEEGFDPTAAPAQAVTSRVDRWQAHDVETEDWPAQRPAPTLVTTRRSRDGALVGRQLPPGEGVERGGWAWRNGTQRNASVRGVGEPAPTVFFGHSLNTVVWVPCADETCQRGAQPRPVESPAPTMLAAGLAKGTPVWAGRRPATTVACDRRVHPPGHKQNAGDPPGRYQQRRGVNAVRVTVEQAAILQGFPAGYPWQGARTRQFEQIGNAVPPPLAHRVLEQAIAPCCAAQPRRARPSENQPPTPKDDGAMSPHSLQQQNPDELIAIAQREHKPVATWCLFSGGNDSTVVAHRCREHYDGLAWIDTGTAVPGVETFVREYAAWIEKPLRILSAGDAFRTMVLGDLVWWARFIAEHDREPGLSVSEFMDRDRARYGRVSGSELGQPPHGFPGPAAHGTSYWRLKGRALEELRRQAKQGHPRSARVLFLSGVRRAESRRRSKREGIERAPGKATVFANPLIDWTGDDMRAYRRAHRLPESPAAALLHRSGECNCGAFAKADGERAMLKALYPEFFAGIEKLEQEAQAAGIHWCRWGGYDLDGNRAGEGSRERPGLLCESCEARQQNPSRPARQARRASCCDGRRKPSKRSSR